MTLFDPHQVPKTTRKPAEDACYLFYVYDSHAETGVVMSHIYPYHVQQTTSHSHQIGVEYEAAPKHSSIEVVHWKPTTTIGGKTKYLLHGVSIVLFVKHYLLFAIAVMRSIGGRITHSSYFREGKEGPLTFKLLSWGIENTYNAQTTFKCPKYATFSQKIRNICCKFCCFGTERLLCPPSPFSNR